MEVKRIEYIRKNDRFKLVDGVKKMVSKGEKKGVLYCGVDPNDPNSVLVGFSLCNSLDEFDRIMGTPNKGFGLKMANSRAEKWRFHDDYFIQKSWPEDVFYDDEVNLMAIVNPNPQQVVEIPPSVTPRLKIFIQRCRKYYKDKEFPTWIEKFEKGIPYPEDLLELKVVEREFFELPKNHIN